MKQLSLLDDSLTVHVTYEKIDSEYDDNIRICFQEVCPAEEKLFKADETNMYLTADQANQLALVLIAAAKQSLGFAQSQSES